MSSDPTIYHAEHSNHMTEVRHVMALVRRLRPRSIIRKISKRSPNPPLTPASMGATMEEDHAPTRTSPPPPPQSVTQSVTDLLRAHWATSEWKIVSSTHLLAQCHDTGCDLCAQYIVHLA